MAVVMIALDGCFLDGTVHAFDLSVGTGMVRVGEAVFDSMNEAEPIERMSAKACRWDLAVLRQIGERGTLSVSTVWMRYGTAPTVDRTTVEFLPRGLAAFDFRQPIDAVPFQTAMQ